MSDLFLRPQNTFEKSAAEVALPEDPNAWPNEIMQELFKQVPYVADFQPNVEMVKVDAERGYALGFIDISSKTEMPTSTPPETQEAAGIRRVRVPIIVSDRKLQPFDVLLTESGKMLPLTEERLRQACFRPQTFDMTSRTPGDQSIVSDLYPPNRLNSGMGIGGLGMGMGLNKQGSKQKTAAPKVPKVMKSALATHLGAVGAGAVAGGVYGHRLGSEKKASILSSILPTINDSDFLKFRDVLENPSVRASITMNKHAMAPALRILGKFSGGGLQKRAAAIPYGIKPTVVQIITGPEGYTVKTANHDFWAPHSYLVDRGRLVKDFGTKIALAADTQGAVTMVEGGAAPEEAPMAADIVSRPGVYSVHTDSGEELVGHVIPGLLDLDGTALPIALFTNGSQMAVQGEIIGTPAETTVPLAEGSPQGHGCFFREGEHGLEATIPMELRGSISEEGEVRFVAETYDGRPVDVAVQPNIQVITMSPDGHVLIPEDFKWMPLQGDQVALASHPDEMGKAASALRALVGSVTVRAGGHNSFSISGPPVEKLAHDDREFIDLDKAMFILGGLGADPHYAATKLAHAATYGRSVEVRCNRLLTTLSEARDTAKTAGKKTLEALPVLRRELFKEAAAIPDPVAVDTVLSLGFINPENMTHFITFLPTLEEAQSKLCELLVATRLGIRDIPTSPLEKSIKSVEEVIRGLKVMAFAQN